MNNTNKLLYRKIILLPLMLIILLLIQSKFVSGFNLNTAVHVNNKCKCSNVNFNELQNNNKKLEFPKCKMTTVVVVVVVVQQL